MRQSLLVLLLAAAIGLAVLPSHASKKQHEAAARVAKPSPQQAGHAEARLIEAYQLLAAAQSLQALEKAEKLVGDFPNFQLAQLLYGDLLALRKQPVRTLGDVPGSLSPESAGNLLELRAESQARLKALLERPPPGAIPSEFVSLSARNKHAIAVDASRSRLYLFENRPQGLALVADYYLSLGKSGVEKALAGDLRTPLGVYFITSNLDPKLLSDFYGVGALPINYPNMLDTKRGKTGNGIWLHGTPPNQFSRPPRASDGCLVLTNPDLLRLIQTVEINTTPVVISQQLRWVSASQALSDAKPFQAALSAWTQARALGDMTALLSHYSQDFDSYGKTLAQWAEQLRAEQGKITGSGLELKDLSMVRWTDVNDTMIVTFGQVAGGSRSGPIKRQYWMRQGTQWKIFFEGVVK